jgi:hypothetical protein
MADPKQIADALAQDELLAQFNRNEAQTLPWYMKPLNMEGRATFLPFKDTLPDSVMNKRELALPGVVAGVVNAITAPNRAYTGSDPTFNAQEEAMNLAGNVMGGGLGSSAAIKAPTGVGGVDVAMFNAKPTEELIKQRIRQIQYDRRLSKFENSTDVPNNVELNRLKQQLKELKNPQTRKELLLQEFDKLDK